MKTQVCFIVTGYMNYLSKHCCAPLNVESVMWQKQHTSLLLHYKKCHVKGVVMLGYTYLAYLLMFYFWVSHSFLISFFIPYSHFLYVICLVVRVSGYRYRGPGFDSRRYQIFWVVVGLERGRLSLVRSIEELLEKKSSGSGLENRD